MTEKGLSVRRLAAELQTRQPRKDIESWRRSVRAYRADKEAPGEMIATMLSEILGYPDGHFFKPRGRWKEEREALLAENRRLRDEIARMREQPESGREPN